MIKLTLNKESKKSDKPFPKIMISRELGTIVLFKEEHKGTVLRVAQTPNNCLTVGQYVENFGMRNFEEYNEPITLENE